MINRAETINVTDDITKSFVGGIIPMTLNTTTGKKEGTFDLANEMMVGHLTKL